MKQELAYSFHLGSDKNKSKLAKKVAKENISGTTSLSFENHLTNLNYLCIINIGNETQKCVVTYKIAKTLHCLPKHNVVSLFIPYLSKVCI